MSSLRYDLWAFTRNYRIEGISKAEVFKRAEEKLKTGEWDVVHPIKKYMNSYENLTYYITVRRKNE